MSKQEKIRLLEEWKYDALEKQVAEEENMGGGPPDKLDRIIQALHKLGAHSHLESPTKHGG